MPTAARADKVAIDFIVESLCEAMRLDDQRRLDAHAKVVNSYRLLNDIITCGDTRGAGIYKKNRQLVFTHAYAPGITVSE